MKHLKRFAECRLNKERLRKRDTKDKEVLKRIYIGLRTMNRYTKD